MERLVTREANLNAALLCSVDGLPVACAANGERLAAAVFKLAGGLRTASCPHIPCFNQPGREKRANVASSALICIFSFING